MLTLKALRQNAPRQDRNDPALVPSKAMPWNTRKVAINLFPRTITELREMSRDFGEAAVSDVGWSAVLAWLMKAYPISDKLKHPYSMAMDAVTIARDHDRYRLGWPRHDGSAPATAALFGLTPDRQRESMAVADDTLAAFEAAGCPYLDERRIAETYSYLAACLRLRQQTPSGN